GYKTYISFLPPYLYPIINLPGTISASGYIVLEIDEKEKVKK
ncbi:16567_t:CDS:1, partial [Funneliformis geosporum]